MNEKKFSKKLNDMTPEEKQRKDALWGKISLESGIDIGEKKVFSPRLAMTVAMCALVLCIAVPLMVVELNKPTHQAGGCMTSGDTSFNSALLDDDPNRFKENEYIYVASTKTIEEIAKNDSNVLFVKDWKRGEKATSFMKEVGGANRVIGILDKSVDTNDRNVSVNILYEDISIVSIDKAIEGLKGLNNNIDVNGIEVLWQSRDEGGCASFVYNKYTYFVKVNVPSGEAALNVAQSLITSKIEK